MKATSVFEARINVLLAGDTGTIDIATGSNVHLIMAPFTPSLGTDFTVLTEADFTGSATLASGFNDQQSFFDPTTNSYVVQLLEPAGGWHWVATAGTHLPETIYGYAVTNTANTVTYGSALLPSPVTITSTGDAVDIGQVRWSIPVGVMF